ncbi:glutaredoxin family protein [Atopobium deltae]|nr:glutaredoxin [Atopobium deltae]
MPTQDLQLYHRPTCPYCVKVLRFIEQHNMHIELHNVSESETDARFLAEKGGKSQVPCLFIDGEPLYESDDIIQYLDRAFA